MVEVIGSWIDSVDCTTYYTVQVNGNKYVDVKCCNDGFAYIMQCEDGNEVYDYFQNTYKEEIPNREEIINYVLEYHKQRNINWK